MSASDAWDAASAPEPLVRFAAATRLQQFPMDPRRLVARRLLADPVLAVRLEAAAAVNPTEAWPQDADRALLAKAQDEYLASQRLHADQPDAHTDIAAVLGRWGGLAAAEAALNQAFAIEPNWLPALLNKAALFERSGHQEHAGGALAQAAAAEPPSADAFYAYGLWLTRAGRAEDAETALRRARDLAPERMEFAYAHALALNATADADAAINALDAAHARFGAHRILLHALATMNRDAGRFPAATPANSRSATAPPTAPCGGTSKRGRPRVERGAPGSTAPVRPEPSGRPSKGTQTAPMPCVPGTSCELSTSWRGESVTATVHFVPLGVAGSRRPSRSGKTAGSGCVREIQWRPERCMCTLTVKPS